MAFLIANWWWLSPLGIPAILGAMKVAAKLTPSVQDDKIVTLLAGLWDIVRGKVPRGLTGKKAKEAIDNLASMPGPEIQRHCRGGETPEG